jgi:N,N'-diacetyllegionaminate synthase
MANLGEVERAITELENAGGNDITLLHCTSNYPCPFNEVNLRAMGTLRTAFGFNVGYSDHTQGISVPIAAVALGASVIEKHFTLDKSLPGPDHSSSIDPDELHAMVESIRNIEAALGDGIKKPAQSELDISRVVRRKIVASKLILKGTLFSSENLTTKRTSDKGLPTEMWDYVIGHPAPKDFAEDEGIEL